MGGTAGAIITCPLEVVKTRLQSSNSGFGSPPGAFNSGGGKHSFGRPTSEEEATAAAKRRGAAGDSSSRLQQWRRMNHKLRPAALGPSSGASSASPIALSGLRHAGTWSGGGPHQQPVMNVVQCLRYITETEGARGLFRGLGPNLVGVAPSRAIYFFAYSTVKRSVNASVPASNRDTPFVHVVSAACAGDDPRSGLID